MKLGTKRRFTIKTLVLHRSQFTLVLSEILSNSYACGKRQIFAKDFTKDWVGYPISLVSIAIAKESLFGIAIAKLSVNGPLVMYSRNCVDSLNMKEGICFRM